MTFCKLHSVVKLYSEQHSSGFERLGIVQYSLKTTTAIWEYILYRQITSGMFSKVTEALEYAASGRDVFETNKLNHLVSKTTHVEVWDQALYDNYFILQNVDPTSYEIEKVDETW